MEIGRPFKFSSGAQNILTVAKRGLYEIRTMTSNMTKNHNFSEYLLITLLDKYLNHQFCSCFKQTNVLIRLITSITNNFLK